MDEKQMDMREVGQRIRHLRRMWQLNQRELAAKLSVSHPTVAHWEVGDQRIGMSTLERLARLFGVRPEWLASGEDPMFAQAEDVTEWPTEDVRTAFGYELSTPPADWPPAVTRYLGQALKFAIAPSANGFEALWVAAREMGRTESPLGIERALRPQHRGVFDMIMTTSDAALDAVEDAVRAVIELKQPPTNQARQPSWRRPGDS